MVLLEIRSVFKQISLRTFIVIPMFYVSVERNVKFIDVKQMHFDLQCNMFD